MEKLTVVTGVGVPLRRSNVDTDQIIRHYDVTGKECPLYYVRNPEAWEQFLADLKE